MSEINVSVLTRESGLLNTMGGNFYIFAMELADMATSIDWSSKNIVENIIMDHISTASWNPTKTAKNLNLINIKEPEKKIAFLEGTYYPLNKPQDYFFVEGMRAPKKRNPDIRLCYSYKPVFNSNNIHRTVSIQDAKNYDNKAFVLERQDLTAGYAWSEITEALDGELLVHLRGDIFQKYIPKGDKAVLMLNKQVIERFS